jgi:hypothetical protein
MIDWNCYTNEELGKKIEALEKQCEWCLKLFLPEDLVLAKNGSWRIDTPDGFVDAPAWLVTAMQSKAEKAERKGLRHRTGS